MDHFTYQDGALCAEQRPVAELAEQFGTPLYIYSRATIERHWRAFDEAFGDHPHTVCYAVKANSNLAVLNLMARLGSGFDIVSRGELERVLAAGGDPAKVVFSGVAKTEDEIRCALDVGIACFNVESEAELARINDIALQAGTQAPVSIRVNPDVDAQTHPYISTGLKDNKFGIAIDRAVEVYQRAADMEGLEIVGLDCHIGSQLTDTAPFVDAVKRLRNLVELLSESGISLKHLDVGGGLGIRYQDETPPEPKEYVEAVMEHLADLELEIMIEPGRAIVGNAGLLVTRVEYLKNNGDKHFAIVDAGMNDLLRPALYQAWQEIIPVQADSQAESQVDVQSYDIVGPVCETGDFLGKERRLALQAGDLLAVRSSGAYGFTMSSNYNSRPRAAEVMVDGENAYLIRRRETVEELFAHEQMLPAVR